MVVRDPVTRAISDYTQAASKRKEMKSFEEMAFPNKTNSKLQLNRMQTFDFNWKMVYIWYDLFFVCACVGGLGTIDTTWGPIKIGIYARYLERWLQYFSLSQFLFVSGERLIFDPA